MSILLDESVPRLRKLRLPPLNISIVQDMGWAGIQNGELVKTLQLDLSYNCLYPVRQEVTHGSRTSLCQIKRRQVEASEEGSRRKDDQ